MRRKLSPIIVKRQLFSFERGRNNTTEKKARYSIYYTERHNNHWCKEGSAKKLGACG